MFYGALAKYRFSDILDGEMEESRWRIDRELEDGERILWSGRGRRPWHRWLLLFGVIVLAFPLRIASSTSLSHPGTNAEAVVFIHSLAPWLWAGYAILAVLTFVENRKTAFYGVTNRRLLIVRGKAQSIPLRRIGRVVKTERPDGSGDLKFPKLGPLTGFYRLETVRDAERAVTLAVASLPAEKKL